MRGKSVGAEDASVPHENSEQDQALSRSPYVVCAACEHVVSDADARVVIAGRHLHTCVNPSGVVFRIRCFARAPGCTARGEWSDFYSWFAGYMWQVACCAECGAHLGWAFRGTERDRFWGLIKERIVEEQRGVQ